MRSRFGKKRPSRERRGGAREEQPRERARDIAEATGRDADGARRVVSARMTSDFAVRGAIETRICVPVGGEI